MAIGSGVIHRPDSGSRRATAEHLWVEAMGVAAILVLAAGLRFTGIGNKSFWADEAYSAFVASHAPREIVGLTARDDAHPPLYYLVLSLWGRLAGTNDADLRSLSAVVSILTVGGAWWIGRWLGGPVPGMYAALLTAVSPFQVLAAQEARMYALLAFLTVLSWAALLAAIEARWEGWVVYIAASTLALYTHYFAFLNLLGQAVFVLGRETPLWRRWAISQFVILGMYLPWLGRFLATVTSGQGWPFLRPPLEITSLTALLGLLSFGGHAVGFPGWFGGGSAPLAVQTAILAPFVGLAALGFVAVWGQPRARWFVVGSLIVPLGAVLAFSLRTNVIYPRYFSFLHVPFVLLLVFGMFRIASYVAPTRPRVATLALGLLFLLVGAPVLRGVYLDPRFQVYNWRDAAMWLATEAGPSDLIIVTPAFGRVPFSRYFRGPQPIIGIDPVELSDPKTASAQPRQAMEARARALFQSYAASHEVMWIITDGGLPQTALVRLATLLDGIYDPQGFSAFSAIRVYKAKRHVERVSPVSQDGTQLAGSAWHRVVTLC